MCVWLWHAGSPDTFAGAKPKWAEVDSELPYNKNRTATLWNGTISIYQVCGAITCVTFVRRCSCCWCGVAGCTPATTLLSLHHHPPGPNPPTTLNHP
jgi:hypothetical protein